MRPSRGGTHRRRRSGWPPARRSATLGGLPRSLPALLRAYKLGKRAAGVGFDWARPADVVDKIREEVDELAEVVASGDRPDPARAEEEMGDLLFAIANLSRKLDIEPEAALRKANEKFTRRFDDDGAGDRRIGTADAGPVAGGARGAVAGSETTLTTKTRKHEERQVTPNPSEHDSRGTDGKHCRRQSMPSSAFLDYPQIPPRRQEAP